MVMLHLFLLLACANEPPEPQPVAAPPPHWEKRTDLALDAVLTKTCEASIADKKPILLEFSAPWCADCKKLEHMEKQEDLMGEYANWHRVRVDVGRFDRHEALREAFGVYAIAHWTAMKPISCKEKAPSWPRLNSQLMELETGSGGPRTVADVVKWLVSARS